MSRNYQPCFGLHDGGHNETIMKLLGTDTKIFSFYVSNERLSPQEPSKCTGKREYELLVTCSCKISWRFHGHSTPLVTHQRLSMLLPTWTVRHSLPCSPLWQRSPTNVRYIASQLNMSSGANCQSSDCSLSQQ